MILWKTAIKNMFSELTLHIITILQMASAMVITGVLISSILIRYQCYTPLKEYFQSNGIYAIFDTIAQTNLGEDELLYDYYLNSTELKKELNDAKEIIGCSQVLCNALDEKCANHENYAYTDNLIQSFTPEISEGRWLNTSDKAQRLEVVISENGYDWEVGDIITLEFFDYPNCNYYDAVVVGKLSENAKIPGGKDNQYENINFRNFYRTYSYKIEEVPIILMSSEYLETLQKSFGIHQGIYSSCIITYPEDYTKEQLKSEQAKLANLGCVISMSLHEMDLNSVKYLYAQMYNLFPIILVLMVLTAVGCISSSALTTRRRLRDYAIYYVNGLQWKQCIYINILQSILSGTLSILISFFVLIGIRFTELSKYVYIIWNWQVFTGIAVVFILYIGISLIMPLLIIGHNTPKKILTK